jgi:hypothetical protein
MGCLETVADFDTCGWIVSMTAPSPISIAALAWARWHPDQRSLSVAIIIPRGLCVGSLGSAVISPPNLGILPGDSQRSFAFNLGAIEEAPNRISSPSGKSRRNDQYVQKQQVATKIAPSELLGAIFVDHIAQR